MEINLESELENNTSQNEEISNLIQELSTTLEKGTVLVYNGYDCTKFTNENIEKICDKLEELISENITENPIENAEENKLYYISYESSEKYTIIEYSENYDNKTSISVDKEELPENTEEGMFFRKVGDNYVFDAITTKKIYNEMMNYQNKLIEEQDEFLNTMRKEGAIYEITYLEDDGEYWQTKLTNVETGETFQELEFPQEIYNQIGDETLVKYKNGTYSIIERSYVTKDETSEELYKATNLENTNDNSSIFDKIFQFISTMFTN